MVLVLNFFKGWSFQRASRIWMQIPHLNSSSLLKRSAQYVLTHKQVPSARYWGKLIMTTLALLKKQVPKIILQRYQRHLAFNTFITTTIFYISNFQLDFGTTLRESICRLLPRILSHELCLKFNWAGKSGWKAVNPGQAKKPLASYNSASWLLVSKVMNSKTWLDSHREAIVNLWCQINWSKEMTEGTILLI